MHQTGDQKGHPFLDTAIDGGLARAEMATSERAGGMATHNEARMSRAGPTDTSVTRGSRSSTCFRFIHRLTTASASPVGIGSSRRFPFATLRAACDSGGSRRQTVQTSRRSPWDINGPRDSG